MRRFMILLLLVILKGAACAYGAPVFSKGTAISGVVIYRDSNTATQFWYIPAQVPLILGESLQDFKVTYWGIGKKYLFQYPDGSFHSVMGAVLSGRAAFDISKAQRDDAVKAIQSTFGVQSPQLLPIPLTNVTVQPVVATNALNLNAGDTVFPAAVAFGSTFSYQVGTGNQLFAEFVATQTTGTTIVSNPHFAVNVEGDAEFVGDPWEANCKIDLNEYWHKAITSVNVSVSWGWFHLGSADYASVVQTLTKSLANDCSFVEGSLDTEKYGRQVFEMVKKIMEDLNAKAASGEGFFKFEPNPEPPATGGGGGGSWWPWSVSINASYSSATSIQDATVNEDFKYTGRFKQRVPASMVLAVDCNAATADRFVELEDPAEPCITPEKADRFNTRMQAEADAKGALIKELRSRYEAGEISFDEFVKEKAYFEQDSGEDLVMATRKFAKGTSTLLLASSPSEVRSRTRAAIEKKSDTNSNKR
jgi:hypothetical protein